MADIDTLLGYRGVKDWYDRIIGNTGPSGFIWNDTNTKQKLGELANDFEGAFTNLVGRSPNAAEFQQMFSTIGPQIANSPGGFQNTAGQDILNQIQQYVGNSYQQTAKDFATQQLQNQVGQARDLADQYRQMGTQALDSTKQYLLDYQNQLFNRLQPQIITSMQAQGLLNTGGYNEAMAGAQKDLAAQAQGYLADANLQMQNQANQIAFSGAASPYYYQQANIMNQVPYLQQQAANAMNFQNQNYFNNQAFGQQMALQNNYFKNMQDMQPSFLRTLGQGFADSFGNHAGQYAAQMPFGAMQAYGSQSSSVPFGAAMLR